MIVIANLFNHAAVQSALIEPDGWRGSSSDRPTFYDKVLFDEDGYRISLHKFVGPDLPGCFHSHPAVAIRAVITGGYVEEFPDGNMHRVAPGYVGLVRPEMTHRIDSLISFESVSLWIRTPVTHEVDFVGDGWAEVFKSKEKRKTPDV